MKPHRYLNPFWWSLRLSQATARFLPDAWVMGWIGRASLHGGEPELRRLSTLVDPYKRAIDIGAAEGVYAWHLNRLARDCIAFEPNPAKVNVLRRRLPSIELYDCALSSRIGIAQLRFPVERFPLTGLGTLEPANDLAGFSMVQHVDVQTRTLDSFNFQDVGFMKIDVEGHELDVLHGACDTLMRDRPVLLIEIEERHRPNALSTVNEFLSGLGYCPPEQASSPQNYLFRPHD